MSEDALVGEVAGYLAAVYEAGPDRFPGSPGNARAVAAVTRAMRAAGLSVDLLPFETVGWRPGPASIGFGSTSVELCAGPFSPPLPPTTARLRAASSAEELADLDATGAVLFVHGALAARQLTPRGYPFYSDPAHGAVLESIERAAPVAVLAATGTDRAAAAALSPFPLIEDGSFRLPSAYLAEKHAPLLLALAEAGEEARFRIDSERFDACGHQPVGRLAAATRGGSPGSPRRVLLCAHLDTKHGTPGALDNAAGVATVLAAGTLLARRPPEGLEVEVVPFNGEDHWAAPGEVVYLAARPPGDDLALVVNVDAAGLAGGPCAVSTYNLPERVEETVAALVDSSTHVTTGEAWYASDHAIFAMQGIPAVAITSAGFARILEEYAHTPDDTIDLVDVSVLAHAARFIDRMVRALA